MLKLETSLASDFLLDNYKTLQRRNDFEDLCDDLDNLQEELISEVYGQAVQQGRKEYARSIHKVLTQEGLSLEQRVEHVLMVLFVDLNVELKHD